MILNKINIIYIRKNFQITFLVTFSLKENKEKETRVYKRRKVKLHKLIVLFNLNFIVFKKIIYLHLIHCTILI